MADWSTIANVLTATGFGAVVGGVANSLIQVLGKRGSDRADIADRLSTSADKWIVRVEKDNAELRADNRALRQALEKVIDVGDEVINTLEDPALRERLRATNREAREAL